MKYYFTLLEVLIAMAVIAVVAGAVGWNLYELRREQEFHAGVSQVVDKLIAAQEIMLIHNDDVSFIIERNNGILFAHLQIGTTMKSALGRQLTDEVQLIGIRSMAFANEETLAAQNKLTLKFSAVNHRTPKGTLILSAYDRPSIDGPLISRIQFNGNPQPIVADRVISESEINPNESEELYPHELRQAWELNQ